MKHRDEIKSDIKEEFIRNKELFRKIGRFQTLQFYLVLVVFGFILIGGAAAYGVIMLLSPTGFVDTVTSVALTALAVCLVISTIIAAVLSKRLVSPMEEIIKASRRSAGGDFSVRVSPSHTFGEVRAMVESFNYMNRELSGIEMFRKNFISNFSHEFITPIVSIRGFASQLTRDDLTDQQRKEYAGLIVRESDRLTSMSSNILTLTRFENQSILGDKTEFSLDEQLRDCILLLQREWEKKEIELDIQLDSIRYCGNREILAHVWSNLLSNAVKFTEKNGSITISCRKAGDAVRVTVSDTGIGMDAETQKHIFEKFYQGDTARAAAGNGLGLPIAKRIVDLCGGTISVKSEIGYGTEMTVTLPC